MFSNNSSSATTAEMASCEITEAMLAAKNGIFVFSYYIVPPFFFVSGMIGHIIALSVYVTEAKTKPPYVYQATCSIAEILVIINGVLFVLSYRIFSGGTSPTAGYLWYHINHGLMWYTAHLAPIILENCSLLSMLTSTAMAVDRFFALARPARYNIIVHKRSIPVITFLALLMLCALIAIPDCFVNTLTTDDHRYYIKTNVNTTIRHLIVGTQYVRNVLEFSGTGLLIIFNISVLLIFRRNNRSVAILSQTDNRRRNVERVLLLLTVSQSIFTALPRIFNIIFEISNRSSVQFNLCYSSLVAPLLEVTTMLCIVTTFYFNIVVSRPFRAAVVRVFLTCCTRLCVVTYDDTAGKMVSKSQSNQGNTL